MPYTPQEILDQITTRIRTISLNRELIEEQFTSLRELARCMSEAQQTMSFQEPCKLYSSKILKLMHVRMINQLDTLNLQGNFRSLRQSLTWAKEQLSFIEKKLGDEIFDAESIHHNYKIRSITKENLDQNQALKILSIDLENLIGSLNSILSEYEAIKCTFNRKMDFNGQQHMAGFWRNKPSPAKKQLDFSEKDQTINSTFQ